MTDIADDIIPGPWMQTVANIFPLNRPSVMPFTLGEAVDEFGLWARLARAESWNRKNRSSLDLDIVEMSAIIGPRLSKIVVPQLNHLRRLTDRADIAVCAERFATVWRQRDAITAAFRDLCEAATRPVATTWDLRKLADIIVSQLGVSARGPGNALSKAANALDGELYEGQLNEWFGKGKSITDISTEDRLRVAEKLIVAAPPTGDVVAWIVYRRAIVTWRVNAGPITFLRADWMVPNASREDGQEFAERDEIRILLKETRWMKELETATEDPENRLVLARVSLGKRTAAGAVEDAERRIEAILNIAVGAGGVSWQSTGTSATTVDGRVAMSSLRLDLGNQRHSADAYGIGATSEILQDVAASLNVAMAERPMPEYLVEALLALREAGMTDHPDVKFYGARAVTPRVATALQDHAMELIASVASITPTELAAALEEREVDWQFEQRVLGGIMAPIDRSMDFDNRAVRRAIEQAISHHSGDVRVVSVAKAVELRHDLLALPMTDLTRADLTDALKAVTDAEYEDALSQTQHHEVEMVRLRHRRVRNAISHGNPLTTVALESIRAYSERAAQAALALALEAYTSNTSIVSMLATEQAKRENQRLGLANGRNFVQRNPSTGAIGSPSS